MNYERSFIPYKKKRSIILIGLVLLTVLLLTLFDAEEQIRDSLAWAGLVENSADFTSLFNPHHLLYIPINRIIYISLSPLIDDFSGIDAGRLHSILWALVMVVSMFILVHHLTKSLLLGLLASIVLLTSNGVWVFALQPQAYAPTIGIITLLSAFLVTGVKGEINIKTILIISGLLSVCIFYHQALVIACIPTAYYILATHSSDGMRSSIKILLISGALVFSAYLVVYVMVRGEWSLEQFIDFLTMYGSITDPSYTSIGNFSKQGIVEFTRSLQGAFIVAPWQLREPARLVFILCVGLIVLWNAIQIIREEDGYQIRGYALLMIVCIWLLCIWGNPLDEGWPTLSLMPLLLLAFLSLNDVMIMSSKLAVIRVALYGVLIGFAVSVSARNFSETILPMHLDKGENYETAYKMAEIIPDECITFDPRQAVTQNLSYYFGNTNKDVWDLLSYYYFRNEGKLPFTWVDFKFQHVDCIVILSRVVSPYFTVSGVNGNEKPERWWSFIKWLFDIKHSGAEESITYRKTEVVNDQDGNSYLIIRIGVTVNSSLSELFRYMDNNLSYVPDGVRQPFDNWLTENGPHVRIK